MTPSDRAAALLDHRRTVPVVIGLAMFVRVVMLVFLHDAYYTSGMAQGELARNLVEGRGFVQNIPFGDSLASMQWEENRLMDVEEAVERFPPDDQPENFRPFIAYMMPGQGMLLAATYAVTGEYRYIWLQAVQVLLDAMVVVLIVAIGTMVFSRRVGVLAALLFAVYIPEARLVITATRDALMPVMYLLIAYFAVRSWTHDRMRDYVLFGLATIVTAYLRSEVLLITIWVGIFMVLAGRKALPVMGRTALTLVPIIVLLLPWTVRNYMVFDRLIPTNSGLWMAMWQSFGEYPNEFGAVNNDRVTLHQMQEAGHSEAYDTPEYDALFRPKVLRVLTGDPLWVGWTMVRRLARIPFQMHAWGIPATDDIHGPNSPYPTGIVKPGTYLDLILHDPWRLIVHAFTRGVNLLLYIAVAVWFWRNRRREWRAAMILFSVPLYNILVHVVIGVHARYILPTNPLHLFFAAALLLTYARVSEAPEPARTPAVA